MGHPHRTRVRAKRRDAVKAQQKRGWLIAFVPGTPDLLHECEDGTPFAMASIPNGDGTFRDDYIRLDRPEDLGVWRNRSPKLRALIESYERRGYHAMPVPATGKEPLVGGLGDHRENAGNS
jgi:hypothetical protein